MDIPAIIQDLLMRFKSIDMAESEFKRSLEEDDEMRIAFKDWCHEIGYKSRSAFADYCHEYLDMHDEMFESLTDYYEE